MRNAVSMLAGLIVLWQYRLAGIACDGTPLIINRLFLKEEGPCLGDSALLLR
jgi:hypothetical protein